MPEVDPRRFWEDKIISWERGRYDTAPAPSLLERLADRASDSLRFRLQAAGELLAPHVAGRAVLDLGCGSGRLAAAVLATGAARYHGVDLADAAIEAARARAARAGWDRATFERAALADLRHVAADVVVSLGLLDWLDDTDVDGLLALAPGAHLLHAVAERRASPAQWAHRAYVWLAYGHRTGAYVPRYYDVAALADRARRHTDRPLRVWRHPRLTFGAFLTTLPVGEPAP